MKIIEILQGISEDLQAGGGGVGVGTAGEEAMMWNSDPMDNANPRNLQRPPQIGYGVQIGKRTFPSPKYNADNDRGVVNSVVGG